MPALDGPAFVQQMPPDMPVQKRLLDRLREAVAGWPDARWLVLGASVARGAGDALSDLDAGVGVHDEALPHAFDDLLPLVSGCGDVLDVLRHRLPAFEPLEHRHLFVQYADGGQLDLTAVPASVRQGRAPGEVVLYDPGGVLAETVQPATYRIDGERIREWAFYGWWALGDLAKYLSRDSLWEARQRLGEAREQAFRLWAAAHGVPDATFGLTALLDAPQVGLPADAERTVAMLDRAELLAAALALAELLTEASRLAADAVPAGLPDALAAHVRRRLAACG